MFRKKQQLPVLKNPLLAIPHKAPDVDERCTPEGDFHLRRYSEPKGFFSHFFLHTLKLRRKKYFNLDRKGSRFWKLIDGKRNLEEIARLVSKKWDVDEKEARMAVVQYIQLLMVRNLIYLEVTPGESTKP